MAPQNLNTADARPLERSEDQGLLLQRMALLNQRMLGPWQNTESQIMPRLTLKEAVAMCYEWSAEFGDRPTLSRDFAVIAARLARRLTPTDASSS